MGNNDTHVYIQGTDYVADLGDLSDLQVSADNPVLTVASKRLRKLKTGDEVAENVTSNVTDMGIGYCPSLEEIDSRNLASLTGTVDLTQCPRLRKALFEGTNAANLQIPAGSKIEELSLPDTITTLSLIRLPNLTEDNLKYNSLNALSYLRLEDNDSINNFEMLKNAYTNSPALKNIRVVGFEYNADANDIAMIATFTTSKDENGNPVYQGIDDNGDPSQGLPVLDGTFTLDNYLYESDYNTVKAYYPNLNIDALGFYVDFADPEVLRVLLENITTDDGIGLTVEDVEGVTSIADWFKSNTVISSFNEFSRFKGVTSLQMNAFYGCSALKEITLPDNVTTIQEGTSSFGAFQGCVALQKVIANGVNYIGRAAFKGCSNLEELFIDWTKVTHISTDIMNGCDALFFDTLNLNALLSMNYGALRGLRVRKLIIGGELSALPESGSSYMNYGDKSTLEEVDLPSTLKTITAYSFNGYAALKAVIVRATTPPTLANINAFTNTNNCPIYVPDASVGTYKATSGWSDASIVDRIKPMSEYNG